MFRASSLLSTSTTIHALWTPSLQPKSACVKKCEPLSSSTLLARAHDTTPDSCGTSTRNLGMRAVACEAAPNSTMDLIQFRERFRHAARIRKPRGGHTCSRYLAD